METKHKPDQRRLWLLLPLLVIPFLGFAFYKLGGGKGEPALQDSIASQGINTALPDAASKELSPLSKIGYYQQADRDSAKLNRSEGRSAMEGIGTRLGVQEDLQTREIQGRLELLNREISKPVPEYRSTAGPVKAQPSTMKNDVDRLEALMRTMQENKAEDPEMEQLNTLMQNILDVQHPERVEQRRAVRQVSAPDSLFRAIPAVVAADQKVVQGATVKLLLQDTLRIKGMLIPKGHELFGTCRITNQRLLLDIKNIRIGNAIVPVDLSVWSLDGMIGLDAPEAVLTQAASGGADDAVRGIGLMGFDQSLGVQVAGAGIDAAKGLLSKKLKRIRVKLNSGQQVLLRNNSSKAK